jgi:hypothetical protein
MNIQFLIQQQLPLNAELTGFKELIKFISAVLIKKEGAGARQLGLDPAYTQ